MYGHAGRAVEARGTVLHDEIMKRAVEPASTPEQRERTIDALLDMAGHRQEVLEAALAGLRARRSDGAADLEADHGLSMIGGALSRCRQDEEWVWRARQRRRRTGRRSHRRRRDHSLRAA